jgi:hypothetical protein
MKVYVLIRTESSFLEDDGLFDYVDSVFLNKKSAEEAMRIKEGWVDKYGAGFDYSIEEHEARE